MDQQNQSPKKQRPSSPQITNSLTEQWQADKKRQDQISALAHDLKTALTIIRGNTELLYATSLTREQRECADCITDGYTQMQTYIKTLIDLSTALSEYQLHKETFDLSAYLKQVKVSIDALCRTKAIQLKMDVASIQSQLTADQSLLGRAILNVASNALDYSPRGGTLYVDVHENNVFVEITVTDEGAGFSKEALQHAQEQFYRADDRRSSSQHFGMGLYIADTIVKQHGGSLIVENSNETGGAKVTLKLPS